MNLLLLEPVEASGDGPIILDGRRARHLIEVLGVAPGATVRAGVIGGSVGVATVVDTTSATVTIRFAATTAPPPGLPVTLVVAVPRPKVVSRVVQIATAFGVDAIHLTRSWRVDKAYLTSPRLHPAALALDARLGAEQGGTTRLPPIEIHLRFMPMLDALPAGRRLVAHPGGLPVETVIAAGDPTPIVAAIGPEGGWIEREVATFIERGFAAVSIASAVLRVEAAVAALLGQLALLGRVTSVR